ncbi:MAG: ATP-dependent DNA helicase RecG, partial [Frankiaceae bacterium]|nr:ATP-dependent DNA helicase RecG [Frankiaceae bacterium]
MVAESAKALEVVGDKAAKLFASAFGIETAGELARHYPRRYYERGELTDLGKLRVGEQVTIQVEVVEVKAFQIRPKLHKTDVVVTDGTGYLTATFFNRKWLAGRLPKGTE